MDFAEARYFASVQGRFTSPDLPFADQHVIDPQSWNLYAFVRNNPLKLIDPSGRKVWIVFEETLDDGSKVGQRLEYRDGQLFTADGKEYKGSNAYANKVLKDLNKLKADDKVLAGRLETLENSKQSHYIQMVSSPGDGNSSTPKSEDKVTRKESTGSDVMYDPDNDKNILGDKRTPRASLAHELLGHSYDFDQGKEDQGHTANGIPLREVNAVNMENRSRAAAGDHKRQTYAGLPIPRNLLHNTHRRRRR